MEFMRMEDGGWREDAEARTMGMGWDWLLSR
jgi:hypothetical protein